MSKRVEPLIGIPVKPFGVAKRRLAGHLDARQRARLGKAVTARTAACAAGFGQVVIVTADPSVRTWARRQGLDTVNEASGSGEGLDRAADAVRRQAAADDRAWLVIHADLPLIADSDTERLVTHLNTAGSVIAPSHDGGTSALGSSGGRLRFAYGPGSFARHLRQIPDAPVVTSPGLAFDLDTPDDLARALDRSAWMHDVVEAMGSQR